MRNIELLVGVGGILLIVWSAMGCHEMARRQWPEAAERRWFRSVAMLAGCAIAMATMDGSRSLIHARREALQQAMSKALQQIEIRDLQGARITLENAIDEDNREPEPLEDRY